MNEDYMTQINKADDDLQVAAVKHYQQMAAVRSENEGLRSKIGATADAQQQLAQYSGELYKSLERLAPSL